MPKKVLDVLPGFLTDWGSSIMTSGISKITDLFRCLEGFVKAITAETVFTEDRRNPVFQLMAMEHGPGLKMHLLVKNGDFVQPAM